MRDFTVVDSPLPIFKRGTKGEIRSWAMQTGTDGVDFATRVESGIYKGTMTYSGWSIAVPKNVGKKNETTSKTQAGNEMAAAYVKKLGIGYFPNAGDIDNIKFIKPMLAQSWEKRERHVEIADGVYSQPKLDGIRSVARTAELRTRTGKLITSCPHIEEALVPIFKRLPFLALDGELYNHVLKSDFNTITSIVRKAEPTEEELARGASLIQYHIYDMPSDHLFSQRISDLENIIADTPDCIQFVKATKVTTKQRLDELYGQYIEDGYEGQMVRLDEEYQFKRSNSLIKRKDFITDEFKVARVEEGAGNWRGYAKRFVFLLEDGRECGAGVRGNQATLKKLWEDVQRGLTPDWCTVRYFEPTPSGMPRFPVVIDWGYGSRSD